MARRCCPTFVGRGEELDELRAALATAAGGLLTTVLVAGEAGVGKTRLLEEFASVARADGARWAVGECAPLGEALPYAPVVDALRTLVPSLRPKERADVARGLNSEIASLVAGLSFSASSPASTQQQVFAGVLNAFATVASSAPLVVAVEDVHWADRSTRDLLVYLAHSARALPLLLVTTYRTDAIVAPEALRGFVAELARLPATERLEVRPFDEVEVAAMVAALVGDGVPAEVLSTISSLSGGNAFFVEELVMSTRADGGELSPVLRDVLLSRLDGLGSDALLVVRVASVVGHRAEHRLLARVCALDDGDLDRALRDLVARGLLVLDPSRSHYAFRHALVAEAVYDDILPGERVRLHSVIAAALDANPDLASGGVGAADAERAHHWSLAQEPARALAASVDAGRTARRVFAHAEAFEHFRRALDLWETATNTVEGSDEHVDLLVSAAEAAFLACENDIAVSLFEQALRSIDEHRDPARAGVLLERLGRCLWSLGRDVDALAAYQRAEATVPKAPPSRARAQVLAGLAQILMLMNRERSAVPRAEEAIAIAHQCGARAVEGHALNTLGVCQAVLGDPDTGVVLLQEALRIAQEAEDADDLRRGWVNLASTLMETGRPAESLAVATEGIDIAGRLGLGATMAPYLRGIAAQACEQLGRWDEAAGLLDAALEAAVPGVSTIGPLKARARLAARAGDLGAARADLDELRRAYSTTHELQFRLPAAEAGVEVALAEHDLASAVEWLVDVEPLLEAAETGAAVATVAWMVFRVAADGSAAGIHDLFDGHPTLLRLDPPSAGTPRTQALWALGNAERDRAAGVDDTSAWREAVVRCDDDGDVWRRAYARWRLGRALLTAHDREDAAEALRGAHRLLSGLPAAPLRREVELLARHARITLDVEPVPPAPAPSPFAPFGLTPREEEVLDLVADGHTNREIADTLYISVKTASVHVSHILQKLGVATRLDARAVARRLRRESSRSDRSGGDARPHPA